MFIQRVAATGADDGLNQRFGAPGAGYGVATAAANGLTAMGAMTDGGFLLTVRTRSIHSHMLLNGHPIFKSSTVPIGSEYRQITPSENTCAKEHSSDAIAPTSLPFSSQ